MMWCLKRTRSEFHLKNLGLGYTDPALFVSSQCGPRLFYPIWTLCGLIYHCIWNFILVPYLLWESGSLPEPKYFIYLTNWGYTTLSVTVVWDFVATVYVHYRRRDIVQGDSKLMPWYLKVLWVLVSINNTIGVLITISYYALLSPDFSALSIAKHLLNGIYIIVTLFITAKPTRLLHFYQPIIYGVVYIIFSVIWHAAGGAPIYPILDWSKPGSASLYSILLALLGISIVYILLYLCHLLRIYISFRSCEKNKVGPEKVRDDDKINIIELEDDKKSQKSKS